jgi:hypothetical protein
VTDLKFDVGDYSNRVVSLLWPASGSVAARRRHGLIVLPSAGNPRLLVPAAQRRAAASAVQRYHVRPEGRARISAALLAFGLRTGVVQRLAPGSSFLPGGTAEAGGITAYLREIVSPHCEVAVYVGLPRGNRKPVLLVLEPDGTLAAVAKLGVSPLSRRLIRNEAAALAQLATAAPAQMTVPQVLSFGDWGGCDLLVQSALPEIGNQPANAGELIERAAVEISTIGGVENHRLETSPVLDVLSQRIALLPEGAERALAEKTVAGLLESAPDVQFPVGSWHGDWTPWNVAVSRTDGVLAWDWERFTSGVPAGYDALHFSGQVGAALPGGPSEGLAVTRAALDSLLGPFGIAIEARKPVFTLYLLELLVRYTEDSQARMSIGRSWVDALTDGLGALMADLATNRAHQVSEGKKAT